MASGVVGGMKGAGTVSVQGKLLVVVAGWGGGSG